MSETTHDLKQRAEKYLADEGYNDPHPETENEAIIGGLLAALVQAEQREAALQEQLARVAAMGGFKDNPTAAKD